MNWRDALQRTNRKPDAHFSIKVRLQLLNAKPSENLFEAKSFLFFYYKVARLSILQRLG